MHNNTIYALKFSQDFIFVNCENISLHAFANYKFNHGINLVGYIVYLFNI